MSEQTPTFGLSLAGIRNPLGGWTALLRPARTDRWTRWHAIAASLMALLGVLATFDAWRDMYNWARLDEE